MDRPSGDRKRKVGTGRGILNSKSLVGGGGLGGGGGRKGAFQSRSPSFALSGLRSLRSFRSPSRLKKGESTDSDDTNPWGLNSDKAEDTPRGGEDGVKEEREKGDGRKKGLKKSASDIVKRRGGTQQERSPFRLRKIFKAKTWSKLRHHKHTEQVEKNEQNANKGKERETLKTTGSVTRELGDKLDEGISDDEDDDDEEHEKSDESSQPISMAKDDFISYVVSEKRKERGERPIIAERLNSIFRRPSTQVKDPGK